MKIPTEKALNGSQNNPLVVAIKKKVDEILGGEGQGTYIEKSSLLPLN